MARVLYANCRRYFAPHVGLGPPHNYATWGKLGGPIQGPWRTDRSVHPLGHLLARTSRGIVGPFTGSSVAAESPFLGPIAPRSSGG